ncbi:hypothetical protein BDB01DRAFT_776928 [Pilobolus umbonatus]|nr:hypothetical protein BDB01DRAFT_776928 [Pilobolus umbonatus]
MPVPVEYTSIRRMSTITVPKQDINFDTYDFQLCVPQNNIEDTFESRELEASFCRDFACCGLILNDLHELLQHYEECHVRIEDDENSLFDESEDSWSPSLSFSSLSSASDSTPSSPIMEQLSSIDSLKKKAAAYLSDLYNATASTSTSTSPSSTASSSFDDEEEEVKKNGKKRSYNQFSGSNLDLSVSKKLAVVSSLQADVPTPILTDEDFLAQAGALLASANINTNNEKPYKCPMVGCDKAYKNPNGLKYHNQHGHCNSLNDYNDNITSKPYQCTIGDCGKRYKNLNGLKYHIEHSHMAVLNQTLATFGSSLFNATTPIIPPTGNEQEV